MKKVKIVVIIMFGLLLCGCKKETVMENIDFGNYKTVYDSLNSYIQNSDYPILNTTISFKDGYTETYKLYRDLNVNASNYSEFTELASLEINFTEASPEATISKITYTFPKINTEILTDNSLNAVKNLLKIVLNDKDKNDELFKNLNYPSNDEILKSNEKYNSKYYVYLDKNKIKELHITFDKENKYFIFTYEIKG